MIDTVALKRKIIDMATSGALSSLDKNDESTEALFRRLPEPSKKRKRLLSQEYDYDELFEIPKHWKWIKLGLISSYGDTPTKVMPNEADSNTWILELEDIESGGRLIEKKRVSDKDAIGEKIAFKKNQVLYSKLRPYLKKVLVADEDGISTPELISSEIYGDIVPEYIVLCLTNSYVDRVINKRSYGVKMPRVDAGFMVNLPIPIPSVQEQRRIVNVVNSAFEHILTISELQSAYASNLEVLKSKIIDAGIQGKLTEQLPEDGNAEDLYAAIQEEKEKLIKEKKIKKSKALPEIAEDEIPFEIPDNWKWIRLDELSKNIDNAFADGPFGSNLKTEHYTKKPEVRIIQLSNVGELGWKNDNTKYTTYEHLKTIERSAVNPGNIVIAKMMPAGRAIIVPDVSEKYVLSSDCVKFVPHESLSSEYICYAINSETFKKQVMQEVTGVGRTRTSLSKLRKYLIPLPPLAEQLRIVEKIKDTLSLCI